MLYEMPTSSSIEVAGLWSSPIGACEESSLGQTLSDHVVEGNTPLLLIGILKLVASEEALESLPLVLII